MIKVSIQQKDVTIVNTDAPKIGAPKHVPEERNWQQCNTVIVGTLIPTYINGYIIQTENQ